MKTKVCTKCKREQTLDEYHKDSRKPLGYRSECRSCKSVTDRKVRYGLHDDRYKGIYREQKGLCAICLIPLGKVRVCVDHDHSTGSVRGLLCPKCNTGLGLFRDHEVIVTRAAEYLKKHTSETTN
jgi:hypothetical protein